MLCKVGIIYSNWAMGFRLDMAPLCFLPAGNCLRRVSCSTLRHCVSYRQETICEGFPIRLDAIVFQCGRKLAADSFLLDMALLCFLPAGNYLRMVSYSTWHHRVSCRQETVCGGFPTRHGITVFLTSRKLFAKDFLFGLTPLCFNATGNCLRIVSYSTWHYCVSYRQETICEWFPIRHSNTVFHCDRKLFAKGFLFDMAPLCFLPAGNFFAGRFLDSASDPRNDRGHGSNGIFYDGQRSADSG